MTPPLFFEKPARERKVPGPEEVREERIDYGKLGMREPILNEEAALDQIGAWVTSTVLAVDIETSGLKPQNPESFIYSIAFAEVNGPAVAVLLSSATRGAVKKLLTRPGIKFVAHNLQFEAGWFREKFGIEVDWIWDTMLTAHVLDNRPGICGLKYQAATRYGVGDYAAPVKRYLSAEGSYEINRIKELPPETVLRYNAMDVALTARLYVDQSDELGPFDKANDFFLAGAQALSRVQSAGICLDRDYYREQDALLSAQIEKLRKLIQSDPAVLEWKRQSGKAEFNINSIPQLRELLFDILKVRSTKQTESGGDSVDSEVLERIRKPVARRILALKAKEKLCSTYLGGFREECSSRGTVHPSFNLHMVQTYRSSSSGPNFQNIPKRDKVAKEIIRRGIRPRPGRQLLEVDYSGIEVRISACYHHDKRMIAYIEDPSTDMHRDVAKELFLKDDVSKQERYLAKNGFVFPEFYGSYWGQCAPNIWGQIDADGKQHLKEQGIRGLRDFEAHVKRIEDGFWNKRFVGYRDWKERTWEAYQRKGYVDLHTGFRCRGEMKRNDVLNYPIQGSAFHCLLWSLIEIQKRLEGKGTMIVGQIHDSIVLDAVPEELPEIRPMIRRVMTEDLRAHWDWIIVPLDVEAEISAVDGNWAEMEKIEEGL